MQLLYTIATAMVMCVCVKAVQLPRLRDHGAADAWTSIPDANVTFSSTFCCNDTHMGNVLTSIEALRFCFTDVLLIIDVPHGGLRNVSTVPGWEKIPGGPGGYSEFINSTWGRQMIDAANKTAQAAVALLQSRCPLGLNGPLHPPTWKVHILNYDEPATRMAFESDFGVDAVGFAFSSMYPNTMPYDKLWNLPDTQYVWHSDSDYLVYRIAEDASPNFIETSISLFRSDSRVMMASPSKIPMLLTSGHEEKTFFHAQWEHELYGNEFSKFDARWHQGEALSNTYTQSYHPVSTEAFLLDVQKFRSLLPLYDKPRSLLHGESVEVFLSQYFQRKGVFQVSFDCSSNIVAGHDVLGLLLSSTKSACAKLPELLG